MMLKKFVIKQNKDWDEYFPYLLFAYWEVPQESTGVFPFGLLYDHRVAGSLDVIQESCTGESESEIMVATFVLEMQRRLKAMATFANSNLQKV